MLLCGGFVPKIYFFYDYSGTVERQLTCGFSLPVEEELIHLIDPLFSQTIDPFFFFLRKRIHQYSEQDYSEIIFSIDLDLVGILKCHYLNGKNILWVDIQYNVEFSRSYLADIKWVR